MVILSQSNRYCSFIEVRSVETLSDNFSTFYTFIASEKLGTKFYLQLKNEGGMWTESGPDSGLNMVRLSDRLEIYEK